MTCTEASTLIDADLDGELDLVSHLDLAAHLATCAECAQSAEGARARKAAIAGHASRFSAPAGLRTRVRGSFPSSPAGRRHPARWAPWSAIGLATALAACLAIGFIWGRWRNGSEAIADEAVADHVRSLMAGHLTDVASTDQHTVKPWFAGKLTFSPPVVDLAARGFPLIGGRLDAIAGQPAAALVYRRRQHAINVLIWPAAAGSLKSASFGRDGFHAESWVQDGLNFVAVSEIPAGELTDFTRLFRAGSP